MQRKTKNIICIGLIIGLIALMGLTIYLAKNNLSKNEPMNNGNMQLEMPNGQGNQPGNMQNPPEMPSGNDIQSGPSQDSQSGPTSQNGEGFNGGDMQNPPEKPDGDGQPSGNFDPNNGEFNNPGNMPGGNGQGGMQNPGELPSGKGEINSSLTTPYYVVFALESLALCAILVYLFQSRYNEKSFKETYAETKKLIVGAIIILLSTATLTFGVTFVTNNYVLNGKMNKPDEMPTGMNNGNSSITYSAVTEIKENKEIENQEYTSSNKDENALAVTGDITVSANNIKINKTGDSDGGDNTSFYGTNSGIIAKDGATLTIKDSVIETDATGGNGVFSYGGSATTNNSNSDGTTINISNSTITTKKDNSGGIMTTGGGTTNATNLIINTAGTSSAAIRSDRGGGIVNVDGGTYTTTGIGSPSIYSTAEIYVKNAILVATASEGIVIEGKNSVKIENCELTDTNNKLNGQSTTYKNIFLYQSMSGDADEGICEFTANDSTVTTNVGDTFYITNTTARITLTNNTIVNNDETGNFLRAKSDSWGNSGSNGGIVGLIMNNQKATGNIVVDSVSTLEMKMENNSEYTGAINGDNNAKEIKLVLDASSKIKLTGDSYVTSLENADTTNNNINFNGYKLYVNGKAIN